MNEGETIKKFSKEHSPEERQATAAEIKVKRKEYFEEKRDVRERIDNFTVEVLDEEKNVSEVVEKIKDLENEIEKRRSNKLVELINFLNLKKLRNELENLKQIEKTFEQDYNKAKGILDDLNKQAEDEKKLEEIKNIVDGFYKNQETKYEEWKRYEDDEKARKLDRVIEEEEVLCVHGIHPNFIPGSNSLLRQGVDWETKLKILLTFEPTISVSTIKEGDTDRNMWARMGVILNGGRILSAYSSDAGTVSSSLGIRKRAGLESELEQKYMGDKIREAITLRHEGSYNELVVERPGVAGFYICLDNDASLNHGDLVEAKEIIKATDKFFMDCYAIKGGKLYKMIYDENLEKINLGEEIDRKQITQKSFNLQEEEKKILTEELLTDSPFRIRPPEVEYIASRDCGRNFYIEFNALYNRDKIKGKIIKYVYKDGLESGLYLKNGTEVELIAEHKEIGKNVQYLLFESYMIKREEDIISGKVNCMTVNDFDFEGGWIHTGGSTNNLKKPIEKQEDYLSGIGDLIEEVIIKKNERTKELIDSGDEKEKTRWERFYEDWINSLAFHLYGFGKEAMSHDDGGVGEQAIKIAEKFLPQAEYQKIIDKRLDSDGRLKITIEDLIQGEKSNL